MRMHQPRGAGTEAPYNAQRGRGGRFLSAKTITPTHTMAPTTPATIMPGSIASSGGGGCDGGDDEEADEEADEGADDEGGA